MHSLFLISYAILKQLYYIRYLLCIYKLLFYFLHFDFGSIFFRNCCPIYTHINTYKYVYIYTYINIYIYILCIYIYIIYIYIYIYIYICIDMYIFIRIYICIYRATVSMYSIHVLIGALTSFYFLKKGLTCLVSSLYRL